MISLTEVSGQNPMEYTILLTALHSAVRAFLQDAFFLPQEIRLLPYIIAVRIFLARRIQNVDRVL